MVISLAGMDSSSSNPGRLPQLYTTVFTDPRKMIDTLGIELESRARESNIVYSHAYKLAHQLCSGEHTKISPDQFWVACYSRQNGGVSLELVLSCTEGPLGPYPIFIYSHRPASQLLSDMTPHPLLGACVSSLATTLNGLVPPSRVFSVFSLAPVTKLFAEKWISLTKNKYPLVVSPWYSATSSYCTIETFRGARSWEGTENGAGPASDHVMRIATMDDLDQCAELCKAFAETGPPYELSLSQAREEAEGMIRANQLWVYQLPFAAPDSPVSSEPNQGSPHPKTSIATVVAVTRSTPSVSAITKVYTDVACRNKGYAERLVAHVTNQLLRKPLSDQGTCLQVEAHTLEAKKPQSVVLYVGHTLDATRVYRRVGFVGLEDDVHENKEVEGVEDWLELGFAGANLGHW